MDRTTVFTKTAKGLMEATGKTSHLSRDIRAVLKEVDGRATVELLQTRLGKMSEAKLQEALETLTKGDFVREFSTAASSVASTTARTAPPPPKTSAASGDEDLDFTSAIPSSPRVDKKAEEAAKHKAQAAAAAAEARAKAEAAARAKAAAEAAARAKAEAEARAKAEAAARAKAEAEAKAKALAAARAQAEAEAKAKAEAEARAKAEAEARAKREAEERARKEAEEKARREADELRAKLEQERKAREEAERKAKEEAERQRRETEEKARREADELRAKLEEERKAREQAEREAKEEAERQRRETEEKAQREADELRAKLEEERKAREQAERKAKEEAERRAREEAERKAKEEAERKAREEAERKAKEEAERLRLEAEDKARREAEEQGRRQTEEQAREEAERARLEAEERARREAEEQARTQAEERAQAEEKARAEAEAAERRKQAEAEEAARQEAETRARKDAEEAERRANEEAKRKAQEQAERERRAAEEKAAQQPPAPADSSLEDLVKIETDFDAVLKAGVGAPQEATQRPAGPDEQLQKAAAELERREAEEQARAAEEKARAQANAAAEAEAKRAEEEEGRRKGEGQERKKAPPVGVEEHLNSQAEAQALLDEQNAETERHFADMEKELDAEQAAAPVQKKAPEPEEPSPARKKKEAKESARAVAAAAAAQARETEIEFEPAPELYRPRVNWGKPVALVLFLLIVLGLVAVNFISFDGSIPQFEKAAGAYLQQPVKIKSLHLSLIPRPHWRMDGVSVGNEGQLKVARVNAVAEFGSMFGDKKAFSSIELESPVLGEQGLLGLLFGKPTGRDFKVASIVAKNAKIESKAFILPALDAKIALGEDGAWQKIALETPDHKTSLTLKPDGEGAALEVETNAFSLPFHPLFILENFVASGQIRRDELRLKEFKGGIYDGYLSGNATLKWGADWSLNGEISVRAMDPGKFAPALLDQGRLEGKAAYSMRAKSYDELYDAPRLEGSFDILKGNVLGVDLGRMLQGGGAGGKTGYAELTGSFVREAGRTQLRQLNLISGPVSASGSAEVDAAKRISGRFVVELKSPVAHARANLTLAGTLQEPHFSR